MTPEAVIDTTLIVQVRERESEVGGCNPGMAVTYRTIAHLENTRHFA